MGGGDPGEARGEARGELGGEGGRQSASTAFEGGHGREEVLRDEGEYEGEGDNEGVEGLDAVLEELLAKAEYPHHDLDHENGEEDQIEVVEPVSLGSHAAKVHERLIFPDV